MLAVYDSDIITNNYNYNLYFLRRLILYLRTNSIWGNNLQNYKQA